MSAFYKSTQPFDVGQLKHLIYRTLRNVVCQHPALSAIPAEDDTPSPYFLRLPQIDLAKAATFVACREVFDDELGSRELDQLLEKQHNASFLHCRLERPAWRVVIIHEPDLISRFVLCFVYHHAIADGTSGFAFHRSFLSELCKDTEDKGVSTTSMEGFQEQEEDIRIVCVPEMPLCESLETLHPLALSVPFILKSLWREYVSKPPRGLWTGSKITLDPLLQKSRFQSISFSEYTTQNLINVCRSHGTSVTAALEAALAAALFAELPHGQYDTLRVDGAVSLRRWLPLEAVDENSMGNWVSRYLEEHRRPAHNSLGRAIDAVGLFSWDEARRVKATIDSELIKGGKDSVVGLLRFAGDLHNYFKGKIGTTREESFEFSNVGVFKSGQQEFNETSWQVGRVVFSQSADVVGAAFEVSLVTGEDKCLNVGFSWLEGIVQQPWMDRVVRTYKHLVDTIALSDN